MLVLIAVRGGVELIGRAPGYDVEHDTEETRLMTPAGRTGLKQQRAIETRETLLLAAAAVFARIPYGEARLKDISAESGVSEGSLYFHFGNKSEIAEGIIGAQQDRMTAVLTSVIAGQDDGLTKLLHLVRGLADLVATDVVVQAGIQLAAQPSPEIASRLRAPYIEWVKIAHSLILQGRTDGSISAHVDADMMAEFLNALFVGSQVLSGYADSWASLPERMKKLEPAIVLVLGQPSPAEE